MGRRALVFIISSYYFSFHIRSFLFRYFFVLSSIRNLSSLLPNS
jgi:hypothetical protein